MHGKVGTRRKALAERHPGGKIKHTRSEDRELRRSPAFQRRVVDIVTEAVALVRNPDTGSQIGLAASHSATRQPVALHIRGPQWVTTGCYRIAALASGYVRSTDIITRP